MSNHDELAERAALSLVASDIQFFRHLATDFEAEPLGSIAVLALMPFLSAFVVDSAKYVKRKGLVPIAEIRQHRHLLRTSRQRLKLLDDRYNSFTDILDSAGKLAAINSGWFFNAHRGILGPLKRRLQPDLGIFFVLNEVACTSHVAFLNLGLSEDALSAGSLSRDNLGFYLRSTAEDLGRYTAWLLSVVESGPDRSTQPKPLVPAVTFRDVKSQSFYAAMARRVAPDQHQVCILLTTILSQLNTARVIVPIVAGPNEAAAFKIRLLSLFHAAASLQKLLKEGSEHSVLKADAARWIGSMLEDDCVRSICRSRDLRNNLVHYGVRRRIVPRLSNDLPLFGLVEAHSSGRGLDDVATDVALGLERLAVGLLELLPEMPTASDIL